MATSLGLDFGTTNTVLAVRDGDGTRSIGFNRPFRQHAHLPVVHEAWTGS